MASYPEYDPNRFSNGIPTPDWQRLNDPAATTRWSTGRSRASTRPGSTFKLITAIAGLNERRDHREQDDRRPRAVRVPDRPRPLLHATTTTRAYGRVDLRPRADGVERRVLLHDRRRSLLQAEARAARRERAAGHGPRVRVRQGVGDRAAERGDRPGARRGVEGEGPRRRTRGVPRTRTGCRATASISPSARATCSSRRSSSPTRTRRSRNGGTLREPRLASEVLTADGKKIRDLAPINRAGEVAGAGRDAMLAGLHGCGRGREGHRGARVRAASRTGSVAGKTGTAQVEGKQPTSLFVGMTPATRPAVHRPRGRSRRAGTAPRPPARSCAGSCRSLNGLPLTDVVTLPPGGAGTDGRRPHRSAGPAAVRRRCATSTSRWCSRRSLISRRSACLMIYSATHTRLEQAGDDPLLLREAPGGRDRARHRGDGDHAVIDYRQLRSSRSSATAARS